MASSKLKAKTLDRTTLYYGKFEYRVVLKSPHMFYSWNCKTIDDFRNRIAEICEDYDANTDNPNWMTWRRPRPQVELWEYELLENIFNLSKKYKLKQDFTLRRENTTCCIYTSNNKLLKEVMKFAPDAKVDQVVLMPTGTMTFKKEPPAKYRAYTSNRKMSMNFKEEFNDYLARTPDVSPSNAFYTYLQRPTVTHVPWLWDKYYIDYNDEKNLMMIMLMFPGMIGKKYKLEKK